MFCLSLLCPFCPACLSCMGSGTYPVSPYDSTIEPFWLLRYPAVTAIAILGSALVCLSCIFKYLRGKGLGFSLVKQFVLMVAYLQDLTFTEVSRYLATWLNLCLSPQTFTVVLEFPTVCQSQVMLQTIKDNSWAFKQRRPCQHWETIFSFTTQSQAKVVTESKWRNGKSGSKSI